jgi:hypothetical protein
MSVPGSHMGFIFESRERVAEAMIRFLTAR